LARSGTFQIPDFVDPGGWIPAGYNTGVGSSTIEAAGSIDVRAIRRTLAGFFVSGLLATFLGAILPVWRHHLGTDFLTVGNYFLSFSLGVAIATDAARRLLRNRGLSFVLALACALACVALLSLALVSPPASAWWRMPGLLVLGGAAGLLNTGLCRAAFPMYRHDSAAALNLAGLAFGIGCVAVALVVAGSFYIYTVPSILILLAAVPGLLAGVFATTRWRTLPVEAEPTLKQALGDFKNFGAVLLALTLLFQFGNEFATAGWLPIYLTHRIGMSPHASLLCLALYWLSLLAGRGLATFLLPLVRHRWLLLGSAFASIFGCIILLFTNNRFGAVSGVLFVGAGFAPVYPLIAHKIGHRYHYYRPGFFNGIFSFALTGGMLAPWSLGILAERWDIGVVMGLPIVGTGIVVLLVLLIWLEARLRG